MQSSSASSPIVLFDLDGTIMDSADGVVGSFLAALERHNVPAPDGGLRSRVVGPPMAVTMASLGVSDELRRALLATYDEDYAESGRHDSTVFPGMADLLDDFSDRPLRLAVTTSKREAIARSILDEHGLSAHFEVIAGAAGERRAKADVIAHALAELGVDHSSGDEAAPIVLAGDRSHDVAGAAEHDIPTAFVSWGYGSAEEAEGAAWLVDSPEALRSTILRYLERKASVPVGGGSVSGQNRDNENNENTGHLIHITFVCTGNICRSPMAEKILAHHLQKAGVDGVRVTSAGTGDWHVGDSADHRTETELRTHGYPTEHAAEQLGEQHLSADLVVALDTGHQRAILAQGAPAERVRLLRSFDPEAGSDDVADPYYGGGDGFVTVREQIEAAVPGLLDWARAAVTEAQDRP